MRDFYPDLPKLEAQKEYLDALETNNVRKLREIHLKYGPKVPTATPNICELRLHSEADQISCSEISILFQSLVCLKVLSVAMSRWT